MGTGLELSGNLRVSNYKWQRSNLDIPSTSAHCENRWVPVWNYPEACGYLVPITSFMMQIARKVSRALFVNGKIAEERHLKSMISHTALYGFGYVCEW